MKNNQPITGVEKELGAGVNILSTTDLKGSISYINQDFIDICGFSKAELLEKNHNVVRHPDMPPAAFENLWSTMQSGKPWMGVVKNRCKNGDHYWVDAFVAPVMQDGKTIEYQSVRFRPERKTVERAEKLYQRIREGKSVKTSLSARLGVTNKLILGNLLALLPILITVTVSQLSAYSLYALIVSAIIVFAVNKLVMSPFRGLVDRAKRIFDNPLMSRIYTDRDDEFGHLQLALRMRRSQLNAVVGRISDSAQQLSGTATITTSAAEEAHAGVSTQQGEVMQVATAMTEMAATVQEIARNTSTTVEHTSTAQKESDEGQQIVQQTIASINSMTEEIQNASDVIQRLSQFSENIGGILAVIKGIAEQTNLLALNAAIEAARAGEQGRGFAVVADEVRTLAGRTQESTREIETMIEHIQQGTTDGVEAMALSREKAETCRDIAAKADEALNNITNAISNINDMAYQIATASEEQSAVAEEINHNVIAISEVAENTSQGALDSVSAATGMSTTISTLNNLVDQFMDKRA